MHSGVQFGVTNHSEGGIVRFKKISVIAVAIAAAVSLSLSGCAAGGSGSGIERG